MSAPVDTTSALPQTCVRCGQLALLRIVGRCADCIGDMGLHHFAEHAAWREEVSEEINSRPS